MVKRENACLHLQYLKEQDYLHHFLLLFSIPLQEKYQVGPKATMTNQGNQFLSLSYLLEQDDCCIVLSDIRFITETVK